MSENPRPASVSGRFSPRDLKRLTSATRRGSVGPTTVYYAGVTAPVISAGMAVYTRTVFQDFGLSAYWVYLLSALIAAFAGVTWYLIFMRWSYRQTHGRGDERDAMMHVSLGEDGLELRRGQVRTYIGWGAIAEVRRSGRFITLRVDGSDTLLIPDRWFGKDMDRRDAFHSELKARAENGKIHHGQTEAGTKVPGTEPAAIARR